MSNVIATDVQTLEVGSQDSGTTVTDNALIELFEITLPNGTTLYFHPGTDSDLTDVQFRDKTAPYTIRDYIPMPMMIDGLEIQADGASSRPAFTVANIGSLFQAELGNFKNDDLIGQRLKRRQTLRKYIVGGAQDASPPIEFSTQEYIIDRVGQENSISVTYEVATPFDLENIQIPRRIVVGKYCSWKYQGHASGRGGGCTWNTDGAVNYNGDGTVRAHKAYFDFDDRPLVATETFAAYAASTAYTTVSYVTHAGKFWVCTIAGTGNTPSITSGFWKEVRKWAEWASGSSYSFGTLVRYNGVTIWKATGGPTPAGQIPTDTSPYWVREEVCGKTLQSCKARYGFKPSVLTSANQKPEGATNLAARLPFGSFPGTLKY